MMMIEVVGEGSVGVPGEVVTIESRSAGGVSLRELYLAQFEPMVRVATALLGERAAAEDVVQEAFITVGRSLPSIRGSEVAYLRRSVVNGCRGSVRRGRAAKRQPIAIGTDSAGADVGAAERAEHLQILQALDGLPGRQRQCLVLRYYAGLSDAEIAHATSLHVGSVKTHIRRGLDALRSTLEDIR